MNENERTAARLRTWTEPRVRPIDIARAGGFSRQYVAKVLAGKKRPSERFRKAAESLGIPVDVLIGSRDERAA